jgi:hypothetical protein
MYGQEVSLFKLFGELSTQINKNLILLAADECNALKANATSNEECFKRG